MGKSQIYAERRMLKVEEGVEVEVERLFKDRGLPKILYAYGLNPVVYPLEKDIALCDRGFEVVKFSPRNCGNSRGGQVNLDNYNRDLTSVIDDVTQKDGARPYGLADSMGGYIMGKVLESSPALDRTVLLAPLRNIKEQNPAILNWALKFLTIGRNTNTLFYSLAKQFVGSENGELKIQDQRYSSKGFADFIRSIKTVKPVAKPLRTPTKVFLSGKTFLGLPIRNLDELKREWEALGAEVEVYPEQSHAFCSGLFPSKNHECFDQLEPAGILDKIVNFYRG